MGEQKAARKKQAADCRTCPVRDRQKKLVAEMVEKIGDSLTSKSNKDVKASIGDYIRLLQLQKELEADEPKEIHVRWVEPAKAESEK